MIAGLFACLLSTACLAQADLVTPKDVTDGAVPRMVPFCPVGTTGKYAACSTTNPLPVTGGTGGGGGASTVSGSQEQDVRASATLNVATANAAVTLALNGQGTVGFTFTGLTASGATLTYEQSNDGGTTWTGINEVNAGTGVPAATRTTDGQTRISVSGRTNIRARVSTVGTGTITVATNVSVREGIVTLGSSLPPGGNVIGFASPPPTATFGVAKTTGIGTAAVQVSAADTTNRRTVTNTSALACEIMPAATAYGTGYPLPAGGSFTFDASGRTTTAIFMACASDGGTAAVLNY
ncbi:hypothetical protein [Methylobacterium longum]|uniref:hypothetical protein n=1 Tax=Methylobacterium longum TaxID=767694 RepID=UPI001EE1847B|nr:hypothetical protein [Methylobacterium longum]